MKRITIEKSNEEPVTYDWSEEKPLILGRSPECDVFVDEKRVSRKHCALEKENGSYFLNDLDSSNGTFIDGEEVDRREIEPGDVFSVGNVKIRFAETRETHSTEDSSDEQQQEEGEESSESLPDETPAASGKREKEKGMKEKKEKVKKERKEEGETDQEQKEDGEGEKDQKEEKEQKQKKKPKRKRGRSRRKTMAARGRSEMDEKKETSGRININQKYLRAGLAVVGVIALLWIASYFYRRSQYQESARNVLAQARQLHKDHEHKKALLKINNELLRHYKGTTAANRCGELKKKIENVLVQQNKLTKKYQDILKRYRNYYPVEPRQRLEKRENFIADLKKFNRENAEFMKKHPKTTGPVGRQLLSVVVEKKVYEIENKPTDFLRDYYSDIRRSVSDSLEKRRLGEAVRNARKVKEDLVGTPWADKGKQLFKETRKKVQSLFDQVMDTASKFMNKKKYKKAKGYCESQLDQFRGTDYYVDLEDLIYEARNLAKGEKMEARKQRRLKKVRKEILSQKQEAKRKLRSGMYMEAAEQFKKILSRKDLQEPALKELHQMIVREKSQVMALAELKSRFIERVNSQAISRKWRSSDTMKGEAATIVRANDRALRVEFGDNKFLPRKWENINSDQLVMLFRRLKHSPEEAISLARFAHQNGHTAQSHQILHDLVQQKPDQKSRVFNLIAGWKGTDVPENGFTYFEKTGEYLSPDELRYAELRVKRKQIMKKVKNGGPEVFKNAFAKYQSIYKDEEINETFKNDLKSGIREALLARRNRLFNQLKHIGNMGKVSDLRRLKTELNKRREVAMALIMDEDRYPYPYNKSNFSSGNKSDFSSWINKQWKKVGRANNKRWKKKAAQLKSYLDKRVGKQYQNTVQGLIDKMVDWVRTLWDNPGKEISLGDSTQKQIETLRSIDKKYLAKVGGSPPEGKGIEAIYAMINKKVNLKSFGMSSEARQRIEWNRKVKQYNINYAKKHSYISKDELKNIQITNDYRAMMGSHRVTVNLKLVKCARKHSEWMKRTGNFSHNEDRPGRKKPTDRAQKEGYKGGVSENIHRGSGSPKGAFTGWYNSSGHHRNMVNPKWRCMGTGKAAAYWTQNFGSKKADLNEYLGNGG